MRQKSDDSLVHPLPPVPVGLPVECVDGGQQKEEGNQAEGQHQADQ